MDLGARLPNTNAIRPFEDCHPKDMSYSLYSLKGVIWGTI